MPPCIYLLLCPITGAVRYVGKTSIGLDFRLAQHLSEARLRNLGHRGTWIRSLVARGLCPIIVKDVDISDGQGWQNIERMRIAFYRAQGCDLVNGTDGGDGLYQPSADVRARMKESAIKRAATPEGKRHLQELGRKSGPGKKGKKMPAHVCAAISAANRGRIVSAETRAKMSATRKGRTFSADHRRKISEGKLRFSARQRMELPQ